MEKVRAQLNKLKNEYDNFLPTGEVVENAHARFLNKLEAYKMPYASDVAVTGSWRKVINGAVGLPMFIPQTVRVVTQSVGVVVIVLLVALGVGMATVSAIPGMLPGDTLYGVKIATERAQVTLAVGSESKARLELEFAGRRVEEVTVLAESALPDRDERLATAVSRFKQNLTKSQSKLEQLHSGAQPGVVDVAKIIDRKATEYSTALERASAQMSSEAQNEVRGAQGASQEAAFSAVSVLLDAERSGQLTTGALREKVEEKLRELESSLQAVGHRIAVIPGGPYPEVEAVNGPILGSLYQDLDKARIVLGKAKDFFARGGYEESLVHYRSGVGVLNQLEWAAGFYEQILSDRAAPEVNNLTN